MSRTPRSATTPITDPDDSPAMQTALRWLTQAGLRFTRPTRYQLKIGALSFYPDKGTLYRDGDRQALPERGLPALQHLLDRPRPVRCPGLDDQPSMDDESGPNDIHLKDLLEE